MGIEDLGNIVSGNTLLTKILHLFDGEIVGIEPSDKLSPIRHSLGQLPTPLPPSCADESSSEHP